MDGCNLIYFFRGEHEKLSSGCCKGMQMYMDLKDMNLYGPCQHHRTSLTVFSTEQCLTWCIVGVRCIKRKKKDLITLIRGYLEEKHVFTYNQCGPASWVLRFTLCPWPSFILMQWWNFTDVWLRSNWKTSLKMVVGSTHDY